MTTWSCRFCGKVTKSEGGLQSHYTQRQRCAELLARYLDSQVDTGTDSDSESESESDVDAPKSRFPSPAPAPAMDIDSGVDIARSPESPAQDRRARVDPVDDEDEDMDAVGIPRWFEPHPKGGGAVLEEMKGKTPFELLREEQLALGDTLWAPFKDAGDWELARWLVESGVSRTKMEEFFKLDKIKFGAKPSYHNTRSMYQKIDTLPTGPKWECEVLTLHGDKTDARGNLVVEEVEFWRRDALECIKDIMSNPAFDGHMHYAPARVYRDEAQTNREYGEFYTAERMWELQDLIPVGNTVVPVMVGTDETQLSRFSGDKKAWPVYIGPANIDADIRRKPNSHAFILIGYIPVSKFEFWSKAKDRSAARYQLYHNCMRTLLATLKDAGNNGVRMLCSDAYFRMGRPIFAGHLSDHPERCLVSCCAENRCPECLVTEGKRGMPIYSAPRNKDATMRVLRQNAAGLNPPEFEEWGLRQLDPFWKDLPHCDIFRSFYPDLLHQLHKGVFKDHTVAWATASFDGSDVQKAREVDKRFKVMIDHPSLRHFRQGISLVSQWTGTEYKHMEKVFLGAINGGVADQVVLAVRSILDFIYYAHFDTHTDKSLEKLRNAWNLFHEHKQVFIANGARSQPHFNIPKIHAMQHYVDLIRSGGSTGGTSTELTERMHIDCAKLGYRASNRKDYFSQMTKWLTRREAVHRFAAYLEWAQAAGTKQVTIPPHYKIAKAAPFQVSIQDLVTSFGAADFMHHLETFLRDHGQFPSNFGSISVPFPVYRRVTINIPPVVQAANSGQFIADPIRATRAEPSNGLKKAVPAHFDTILARKKKPSKTPKLLDRNGTYFLCHINFIIMKG
ncbi:hypothetical protein HMN09_01181700 [Mycena chlorophos]|uniref:C2H2-type domain-containing protein n=1 Tax=Mycena chlorophos TaxID=658473 RepID=A0A8H6S7K3_MYCCL|nr:hypothetical protein HMN09_01181700 [Mycena chlorophos]